MAMPLDNHRWTLDQVHALPDDGNRYELLDGVLLVTPAPSPRQEFIAARLARFLDPFVARHGLGLVLRPQAVFRIARDLELSPDLQVRVPLESDSVDWEHVPVPSLVVEVLSPGTFRRDRVVKRSCYLDAGIDEYWIVDGIARTVTV